MVINGDPDKNGFTFDIELHLPVAVIKKRTTDKSIGSAFLNHSNISATHTAEQRARRIRQGYFSLNDF